MPTQTSDSTPENLEMDGMLERLFLVAELLLNPPPKPADPESQDVKTPPESSQKSVMTEADV